MSSKNLPYLGGVWGGKKWACDLVFTFGSIRLKRGECHKRVHVSPQSVWAKLGGRK